MFFPKSLSPNILLIGNTVNEINYYTKLLKLRTKPYNFLLIDYSVFSSLKNYQNFPDNFLDNCKIILYYFGEALTFTKKDLKLLQLIKKDIKCEDIIIFSGALTQILPVHNCCLLDLFADDRLKNFIHVDELPTHHFISLSRIERHHKTLATVEILERNLRQFGHMSFDCNFDSHEKSASSIIPDKFKHLFPMYIDGKVDDGDKEFDCGNEKINKAFCNLVLESAYESYGLQKYPFITEKSAKPFILGQVPIFLTCNKTLPHMRDMGFDLFDDIINHDYDNEIDFTLRIKLVIDQLENICKFPLQHWIDFKNSNKNRFMKNKETWMEILQTKKEEIFMNDFNKSLENKR